jgi:spermidine synthase
VLCIFALVIVGQVFTVSKSRGIEFFWGRDGVVEVRPTGHILIDGLWHSALSDDGNHVGRPFSWFMAIAALMSHDGPSVEDVLVIGSGIGITATSLSEIEGVRVDAYEISHTLRRVMERYPARTLHVLDNPRINTIWQDARSGLALNPKRYDIIVSAPLHLRQAGSSILLSREYLELVRSRLKPGGVLALYSFEGPKFQSLLVRSTVGTVFAYGQTFSGGVVTVASDSPIEFDPARVDRRLGRAPELKRQAHAYMEKKQGHLLNALDSPRLDWGPIPYTITDDHPLVEYPVIVANLLAPAR